jgi:hypothetical protein
MPVGFVGRQYHSEAAADGNRDSRACQMSKRKPDLFVRLNGVVMWQYKVAACAASFPRRERHDQYPGVDMACFAAQRVSHPPWAVLYSAGQQGKPDYKRLLRAFGSSVAMICGRACRYRR